MESVFEKYGLLYDHFYEKKDYASEVSYVLEILKKHSQIEINNLLDIGCGSGGHIVEFIKLGYNVDGVDPSKNMLQLAEKKVSEKSKFYLATADSFKINQQYDAIVSLFHVVGYINTNDEFLICLKNVYDHLKNGGVFMFDFWYGPAVIESKPGNRELKIEKEGIIINRKSESVLNPNKNLVNLSMNVKCKEGDNEEESFQETHSIRYYFLPEIEFMMKQVGFKNIKFYDWMDTNNPPHIKSWYGCVIANK